MRDIKDTHSPNVHIKVQNFGPIKHAEIDLRPLTVFVGESNTGKTYLAALIYALHQHFEGFSRFPCSDSSVISLGFLYRQYHQPAEIQAEMEEEMLETLENLNAPKRSFKFSDLPQWMRDRLESNFTDQENLRNKLKRCFDFSSVSGLIRFTGGQNNGMKVGLKVLEKNQILWSFDMSNFGNRLVTDGRVNQDMVLRANGKSIFSKIPDVKSLIQFLRVPQDERANLYYLPAARSAIMQIHGVIASSLIERATPTGSERFPEASTFSGMIADFLQQIIHYKGRNGSADPVSSIAKALEDDILHGQIEVKRPVPEGYPEFLYRPQQTEQVLRMSQVSAMVSELTPLVLFLRGVIRPGDTLIIEEPEAHLHPRAQTEIALTFARLVRAGVRLVVTTHSEWLLQQIGNLIREGELKKQDVDTRESGDWLLKEDVGAWWFHADKPVVEIPFDRIEGIEPSDYEDIADGLYNTFVELERRFLEEEAANANE